MLRECDKACIYSLDGVFLAEVKVIDSDKENLALIFEEEDMDKVNTESVIVFYDGIQGLVTCKCSLSARVKVVGTESGDIGRAIYKVPCRIDELIGVEQRRRDLKVRVSISSMLETSDEQGNVIHLPAKIKDISAGGIGFESSEKLKENQIFSFSFETDAGDTRLKASVLWVKEVAENGEEPFYRYGSRYFDLSKYQESMVRKYTFQEQLKRRKIQ
ncbi:PilZ domain-containing protein [Lacrimispora amygdalina]|uniref:PilZ domain-containing protein n=1 Tax=Lacrimispora amygdalina TaxID=253257 RepID=UPI000BE33FA5|nr:PilZ domain-containing protein [Lacrimispora amygdalina]